MPKICLCVFLVIPYGGEKHINKIPPKIPGQSRENFVYVFFSLCVLFGPHTGLSRIGILPGWHGMENGQKLEMEKKWKSKWQTAPTWTGAKMAKKWPKNGFLRAFSIIFPFLGQFFAIFGPVQLGPFSIPISIFFPFPAFGRFPCHTSPAGSQVAHITRNLVAVTHRSVLQCLSCGIAYKTTPHVTPLNLNQNGLIRS